MNAIPEYFKDFIEPAVNRGEFIQNHLMKNGLEAPAININGQRHIFVKFPKNQYDVSQKIKTVIAHYDRAENSPGANDNSSSVVSLMEWAIRLNKNNKVHNVRLLFTDGEELGEDGVKNQGSYQLAQLFNRLGLSNDDVYVFDCMGRGTIPVICLSNIPNQVSVDFKKKYKVLEAKAEKLLNKCTKSKYVKLPASYSDNAGFIVNGIPAVAITMLPYEEACVYQKGLSRFPNVSFDVLKKSDEFEKFIPLTWKMFHSNQDCFENLSPEAFDLTEKILNELGKMDY